MLIRRFIGHVLMALPIVACAASATAQDAVPMPAPEVAQAEAAPPVETPPVTASQDTAGAAWLEALQTQYPLSPGQVKELRARDSAVSEAAMSRPTPAAARSDIISVSLEPGASSPVIELLHGFATSIEVLDATGQPWPVSVPTIGDAEAFSVNVVGASLSEEVAQAGVSTPAGIGSVITLAPLRKFAATNLIVVLQNQSRPISVVLKAVEPTATTEFRDRVTISVQGVGPYAKSVSARGYEHLDAGEDLRSALIGRPPRGDAKEILAADLPAGLRAWRAGNTLWIRTNATLISPAHEASVAGGAHRAYRLRYLPVVVMSEAGTLKEINLQEAL
ncbi:hypothetical protein [Dolichospermum phage Dfl-JY45]